jgi:hypothetical protein
MNNQIRQYGHYQHDLYLSDLKRTISESMFALDCSMPHTEPVNVLKTIETCLGSGNYFETSNCNLKKVNSNKQPTSRLYSILVRMDILHRLIPIFLAVFPRSLIHCLPKRFVYGYK